MDNQQLTTNYQLPTTNSDSEVGFATSVSNFLIYLNGLPSIRINDLVQNDLGVRGWVSAILEDKVEVLLLDEGSVIPGQIFRKLPDRLSITVGEFLIGRAINPVGLPIDGKGYLAQTKTAKVSELDKEAHGISQRAFINRQFVTGITLIDTLIPIGRGQRELIMGDARSGKTSLLVDFILNQKNNGVICVYASIGKPITEVRNLIDTLSANNALSYTVVVAASSTDTAPLIFLTPQTAFSIAEYFQAQGKDVLLILDDLGNHAKIYREIALLSRHSPGREAYPGDIFYQHAHLLERAGNFAKSSTDSQAAGGSITAIPVIELNLNDFTGFIPTNVMAMTDGHLLFKSSLYNRGQRPAIDISLSVSRIGQQTQQTLQNTIAGKVKQVLASAMQLETVSRFGGDLTQETKLTLHQNELIKELLKQESLTPYSLQIQTILMGLVFTEYLQKQTVNFLKIYTPQIIKAYSTDPELAKFTAKVFEFKTEEEFIKALGETTPKLDQILGVKPAESIEPINPLQIPQPGLHQPEAGRPLAEGQGSRVQGVETKGAQ